MKVREIIINEGPGSILKAVTKPILDPALAAGSKAAEKLFGTAKKAHLDELATAWARELELHGKLVTPADKILINNPLTKDQSFLKKAAAKAQKIFTDARYAANLEKFSIGTQKAIQIGSNIGWGVFLGDIALDVHRLNKQLANKEITQDQYDNDLRYYLGKAVTAMVTVKVGGILYRWLGEAVGTLPFMQPLGARLVALQPQAKQAFVIWLGTPGTYGGLNQFAQWYAGNSILPEVAETARTWLGSSTLNAWRAIEDKLGIENPDTNKKPSDTNPYADDGAGVRGTPAQKNDPFKSMQFDLGTGEWTNRPQ